MLLGTLADGFRLDDFVVAAVGVGLDPTNVFASTEVPFLQALKNSGSRTRIRRSHETRKMNAVGDGI